MFCINCGKELPDNAQFCNKCGCRVVAVSEETYAVPETEQPKAGSVRSDSAAQAHSHGAEQSSRQQKPNEAVKPTPRPYPPRELTDKERAERASRRAKARKKKQRRKRIIIASIIGAVILCGIAAAVLFGDRIWGNSPQDKQAVLIEQVYNTEVFSDSGEESTSPDAKIRAELSRISSVEVVSENDESHQIEVTAPDMGALLSDLAQQYDDSALIMEKAYEQLSSGDYQTITRTVEVPLDENSNYAITFELLDALYGGLISEAERILAERGIY